MAHAEKLQATVAFLVARTTPGKLKLLKLMYLADFRAHWALGHSITGDTYEHWQHGPVPRHLWKAFATIIGRCATMETRPWPGLPFPEQRLVPTGPVDTSSLSPDEIAILEEIVREFGHLTGKELRQLTHDSLPYKATAPGEEIPYYLAPYLLKRIDQAVSAPLAPVAISDAIRSAVRSLPAVTAPR